MDFKVIWSDAAIADLREICSYIARDDQEAALRMGNGILDHVRILARFPFIGAGQQRVLFCCQTALRSCPPCWRVGCVR